MDLTDTPGDRVVRGSARVGAQELRRSGVVRRSFRRRSSSLRRSSSTADSSRRLSASRRSRARRSAFRRFSLTEALSRFSILAVSAVFLGEVREIHLGDSQPVPAPLLP